MSSDQKIRVLLAKPGLDGHDRGVKVVARALRDAGMEVIYTGLHKSPELIVESALQEDVDVIGLSSLSGAHMALFSRIMELLKEKKMSKDTLVIAGGIIPDDDIPKLKKIGIEGIFGPGTDSDRIANYIRTHLKRVT
ncbi:MAG: cobalamin B12-binding domain-containing protein [Candidatus Hodarchaeales archaeon]|jgi:methylmalonyl-CoA mutase C-terminal domain/subunit